MPPTEAATHGQMPHLTNTHNFKKGIFSPAIKAVRMSGNCSVVWIVEAVVGLHEVHLNQVYRAIAAAQGHGGHETGIDLHCAVERVQMWMGAAHSGGKRHGGTSWHRHCCPVLYRGISVQGGALPTVAPTAAAVLSMRSYYTDGSIVAANEAVMCRKLHTMA